MSAIAVALREGLFASSLQESQRPTVGQARHAAFAELKARTEWGCACVVAEAFGDHPYEAADRMAWCCALLRQVTS